MCGNLILHPNKLSRKMFITLIDSSFHAQFRNKPVVLLYIHTENMTEIFANVCLRMRGNIIFTEIKSNMANSDKIEVVMPNFQRSL